MSELFPGADQAPRRPEGGPEPDLVGDFEVLEELGRGAHTAVFRVRRDGIDYALKTLRQPGVGESRVPAEFCREAALLARVDHRGVPKVFDVGVTRGRPYLVLEYLEGRSLARLLEDGPLEEASLVHWATDVASALSAAHAAGLVHRDLKPANIMVTGEGRARLIDFGLAAAGRPALSGEAAIGTLQYSAPEQAGMLSRPVDGRTDLYSLGVVLYQAATGELPFHSADVGELIAMHASAPAPDPRALRPGLSAGFVEVVLRLLAKDPDDRFTDAGRLRAALRRLDPDPDGPEDQPESRRAATGRDRELNALAECWRQVTAGHGCVALISGEPGGGKSFLAAVLADQARSEGALVLRGKCQPDSALPLAPLRAAIEEHVREVTALPPAEREQAVQRLREAAGAGAALLRPLSPALAVLLDAPQPATDDHHEQFVNAVAAFLIRLGSQPGGVLLLDDVQWLDTASRNILRRLTAQLAGSRLLVLATARNDAASLEAMQAVQAETGPALDLHLSLEPLSTAETVRLVSSYLAGPVVDDELTSLLDTLGRGNPFTILEYLQALIDAGALRPSWGSWRLDRGVLRAINLPTTVLDLVLARIDRLGPRSRELLTVAAAIGLWVDTDLLTEVTGTDSAPSLAEATDHGLLYRTSSGYAFVHDRIQEALLSTFAAPERAELHQRIAEVLDGQRRQGAAGVYATARHYAGGLAGRRPDRTFAAGLAAGQLALDESAPDAAVTFLETAERAAEAAGLAVDSRFREALGVAYWLTGRVGPAREQLESGLATEREPLRRAALLLQLTHVLRTGWNLTAADACARRGLAELGRPVPGSPVRFGLATAATILRWLVTGNPPPSQHPVQGEEAERLRLHVLLCRAATAAAAINFKHPLILAYSMRSVPLAHRIGRTATYASFLSGLGTVAGSMRLRKRRAAIFAEALQIGADVGDPKSVANAAWYEAFARILGGESNIQEWNDVTEAHRDWLELDYYTNILLMQCRDLVARGYAAEALAWHDRARARILETTADAFPGLAVLADMAQALLGHSSDTPAELAGRAAQPLDPGIGVQFVLGAVHTALEQDELGEPFETAIAAFDRFGLSMSALFPEYRLIFVCETFARLTQYQRAAEADRPDRAAKVAAALRRLASAAKASGASAANPKALLLLTGYDRVARACFSQLQGEHDQALELLAAAAPVLGRIDAPLLDYETQRVRARALAGLGEHTLAERAARTALHLAQEHGWARRARWVRTEFPGIGDDVRHTGSVGEHDGGGRIASGDRYRRRLEALQQVSTAAARVLDPQQLARVALDETLRILGAERAMLFLADESGTLEPALGRTSAGADLNELSRYSASLVDRVGADRRPLVVTSTEEGAALGSQSAVVYGLRSIMVAPLELEGRLLGVVYLDSRVAKGVFSPADVEILTAVTSHIAVSLETARAAQLELAVHAVQEQRDTAEVLRVAMNELTGTLDPQAVLRRLRAIVTRTIPAERVCLLHQDESELIQVGLEGAEVTAAQVASLLSTAEPRLAEGGQPVPAPVEALVGRAAGWLVVPLTTRGHGHGVLVAGSAAGPFTRAHVDLVSALAGQGATAYANARLFDQVQHLATTDALTGVANRRHFTEQANRQLEVAARNTRPLAAMMVDVDHFKRVNDSHGHAAGDLVIRAVAEALHGQLRAPDLLGRYGGEEFAILLCEMHGDPLDVAERLRGAVAALRVPRPDNPLPVTVSIGVAELKPDDTLEQLLARADAALYEAKGRGRNQVRAG